MILKYKPADEAGLVFLYGSEAGYNYSEKLS